MDIAEKTRREIDKSVDKLENLIAKNGIGADYLQKAERVQRNLNLVLLTGSMAVLLGLTAWTVYHYSD